MLHLSVSGVIKMINVSKRKGFILADFILKWNGNFISVLGMQISFFKPSVLGSIVPNYLRYVP